MPHDGQNELLKKTGIARNLARGICIPVEMGLPVSGQRIITSLIDFSVSEGWWTTTKVVSLWHFHNSLRRQRGFFCMLSGYGG
jgi:hypothetical protein